VEGAAADAYFEGLDKSNLTIVGGEHATVNVSSLAVAYPMDIPVSSADTTNESSTDNPVQPLKICHDYDMGGTCVVYTPPGCQNNPFVGHSIKSFELMQGWQCTIWPAAWCHLTNGDPQFIDASMRPVRVMNVTYGFSSAECVKFVPDDAMTTEQTLATRDTPSSLSDLDAIEDKLHLFSGANMTGTNYSVPSVDACHNIPADMPVVKSFTLAQSFYCTTFTGRDCTFPKSELDFENIDSTNRPLQNSDMDFNIQSVTCFETFPDGPPGLVTSCDGV